MKNKLLSGALVGALLAMLALAAAAEPSVCSDLASECDSTLCIELLPPADCSTVFWPECVTRPSYLGYEWCVTPVGECKVTESNGERTRCVGELGETNVRPPVCASVTYGDDGACVGLAGPCFVAQISAEGRQCIVGV